MRQILVGTCVAIALTVTSLGVAVAGQFSAPAITHSDAIVRAGDSRENEYYYRNRQNYRHYQRSLREGRRLREQGWRNYRYHHRHYYEPAPYGYYAPPPAYYYPDPDPSFSFGLTLPIR